MNIKIILLCFLSAYFFTIHGADCGNTTTQLTFKQVLYEAMSNNGERTIGPRRFVTNQTGTARAGFARLFLQKTPMLSDKVRLTIKKSGGKGRAEFIVCMTDEDDKQTLLERLMIDENNEKNTPVTLLLDHVKNHRLSVHVKGQTYLNTLQYEIELTHEHAGEVWQPKKYPIKHAIKGFADIHVHQSADLAFAGGWFFGSHRAGNDALNLGNDFGDHGVHIMGLDVYGSHHDLKYGYPTYEDWPSAYDISHQQVSATALKKAHERGLQFMVASVLNNQWLCAATVLSGYHNKHASCEDMESAKAQINALHQFAKDNDWYVIVRDPWEARRAIDEGKLAVMLAVEVSNLFPNSDGDVIQQLHELYAMDVRSVQLAHEVNSLYAGAAFHADVFKFLGRIKSMFNFDVDYAADGSGMHNQLGITEKGKTLLHEMVRLNMLVDLAHLSLKAQEETIDIMTKHYAQMPLFNSHTRVLDLLTDEDRKKLKEHNSNAYVLEAIRRSGGMIGLRTGDNAMKNYTPIEDKPILNNCDGSSRSFIQFYQYSVDHGLNTAFASDFNGFITQLVPRFGEHACSTSKNASEQAVLQTADKLEDVPEYVKDYYTKGLAHIALLPALLFDINALGANTDNLNNSAEHFLKMWEKSYQ